MSATIHVLSFLKWPAKTRKTSKSNFRLYDVVTSCVQKWTPLGRGKVHTWSFVVKINWLSVVSQLLNCIINVNLSYVN